MIKSIFKTNDKQIKRQAESSEVQSKAFEVKALLSEKESLVAVIEQAGEFRIPSLPDLDDVLLFLTDPEVLSDLQEDEFGTIFKVLDSIKELGVLRVTVRDPRRFAEVLSSIKGGFDLQHNMIFSSPPLPKLRMLEAESPFKSTSMQWLGANNDRKSRGQGVKVAILDTGVDILHPSLDGLAIRQISLLPSDSKSATGHGTGITSIIAGQSGESLGLAPSSEILSVRVLDENGIGDAFTIAKGILLAVDEGSRIINLSLGGLESSPVIDHAINVAKENNVILVSAVGNDGDPQVSYPARHHDVVAVSSVDAKSRVSTFSNYGDEVDIAAPGVGVITAWEDSEYAHFSGTSIAAAFVTGALASEMSKPGSFSRTELLNALYANADEAEKPGFDKWSGNGVLNIRRLEQRNTPGVVDAAVVGYYFDPKNLTTAGTKPFSVTVQNQGTSWIHSMQMKVKYKGLERNFVISNLEKGQSRSETLYFDAGSSPGELAIHTEVTLIGQQDTNPENNKRKSLLILP